MISKGTIQYHIPGMLYGVHMVVIECNNEVVIRAVSLDMDNTHASSMSAEHAVPRVQADVVQGEGCIVIEQDARYANSHVCVNVVVFSLPLSAILLVFCSSCFLLSLLIMCNEVHLRHHSSGNRIQGYTRTFFLTLVCLLLLLLLLCFSSHIIQSVCLQPLTYISRVIFCRSLLLAHASHPHHTNSDASAR